MNLSPMGNRVIVKKEEEVLQKGKLILAAPVEKVTTGRVVAVGPGKMLDSGILSPCGCKVGDKVIYNQYGGQPIPVGDEVYTIFYDHDIYAVIKE